MTSNLTQILHRLRILQDADSRNEVLMHYRKVDKLFCIAFAKLCEFVPVFAMQLCKIKITKAANKLEYVSSTTPIAETHRSHSSNNHTIQLKLGKMGIGSHLCGPDYSRSDEDMSSPEDKLLPDGTKMKTCGCILHHVYNDVERPFMSYTVDIWLLEKR